MVNELHGLIYVVVAQIWYDVDGRYEVVRAFWEENDAEKFADGLESGEISKDRYDINCDFDTFEVCECLIE